MKTLKTIMCAALLTFGWIVGTHDDTSLKAEDPPDFNFTIPVDFQASFLKKTVESLTKELESNARVDTVIVNKTKHVKVKVPYRVVERDTSYVPVVLIITPGNRKEHIPDSIPTLPKHDSCSHDSIDTSI